MLSLWKRIWIGFWIGLVFAVLVAIAGATIHLRTLDFENYWRASQLLFRGENPYLAVEFFSPPWLAFFILPLLLFPLNIASIIWLFVNIISMGALAILSAVWLNMQTKNQIFLAISLSLLMPGAMFSYITGQISPLVNASLVFIAWKISTKAKSNWLSALAVLVTTLKPHIVIFPLFLIVLELARCRQWKILLWIGESGLAAVVLSFLLLPDWLPSVISAWMKGDFRGGRPGLISSNYLGLRELGIPIWIFVVFAIYVIVLWWRKGFTPEVFALSLVINLLLIPYSRSYDFVTLFFPILSLSMAKGLRGYFIFVLASLAVFILPFTLLSVLTPITTAIALLFNRVIYSGNTSSQKMDVLESLVKNH